MATDGDVVYAQLKAAVEKATQALALEINANLVVATPVRTGWARANWIPSVGAPEAEPVPLGSNEQQQAAGAVLNFKLEDGSVFVSNNVPYIERLNLGSSQQAAAGFVEVAIEQAVATVNGKLKGITLHVPTSGVGTFSDLAGGMGASNIASAFSPFGGDA